MNPSNILFITHPKARCGVYDFGENVFLSIKSSSRYNFIKVECAGIDCFEAAYDQHNPAAIIYNYHPETMPWITERRFRVFIRNNIAQVPVPQIGIIHDVTQTIINAAKQRKQRLIAKIDSLLNSLFDYYVVADPTVQLNNQFVYKTGRVIPKYENKHAEAGIPVISSFGFGNKNKGYEKIIKMVQGEYDLAKIRINIPFGEYCDKLGINAKEYAGKCKGQIYKPGIELEITHEYWDKEGLLDFLAQSTLNVFLYKDEDRGISSVLDYALAVDRPIAVSNSRMFRHVLHSRPSICVDDVTLKQIVKNGTAPLIKYLKDWTPENLLHDYERILDSVLKSGRSPKQSFVKGAA